MLGTALKEALGDKAGVRRFASALVPLDEALVQVALDLSGRPFLVYEVDPVSEWIGTFDPQLAEEFWRAFAFGAGITLHIRSLSGTNGHHVIEASFKGVARALRDAVKIEGTGVPSTKGTPLSRRVRALPAIDLRGGHCVRLLQGDFDAETVYDDDPVARRARVRSRRARSGSTSSTSTPPAPASRAQPRRDRGDLRGVVVQGAGRRRRAHASRRRGELLDAGVERVVVGTAAVERPELVDELCRESPGPHRGRARRPRQRGRDPRAGSRARRRPGRRWPRGSTASGVAALDRHRDRPRRHARGPDLGQLGAVLGGHAASR